MRPPFGPRLKIIGLLKGWCGIFVSVTVASALTAILATSGLDWAYFLWVQSSHTGGLLMTADTIGYPFPLVVAAGLGIVGIRNPGNGYSIAGIAAAVAAVLGLVVSMALKSIAGRVSPPHHAFGAALADADNSAVFNFGFMNEAILGGWPSSHATVAFAVVAALFVTMPAARGLRIISLGFATVIGIGVTLGFHWLSDFISGVVIGTSIGLWVGRAMVAQSRDRFS